MQVSIIIPTWNNVQILKTCLPTVLANTNKEHEIIVIDNGSTDDSLYYLAKFPIKILKNEKNLGFAKAINQGMKISSKDYFLWLNNDVIVKGKDWINILIENFEKFPKTGAIGPRGGKLDSTFLHNGIYPPNYFGEVDYVEGWCFLTSRKVIEDVGFLDEQFFLFSEDSEWCLRARDKGYKILQVPNNSVYHIGSATSLKQIKTNPNALFDYREISTESWKKLRAKRLGTKEEFLETESISSKQTKHSSFESLPMKSFSKFLIIRLNAKGDILNTTPAVRELKKKYPKSFIGYLCFDECKEMVENLSFIDKVFTLKDNEISPDIFNIDWTHIFNLNDRPFSFLSSMLSRMRGFEYKSDHPLMKSDINTRKLRGQIPKKYVDIFAEMVGVELSDRRPIFISNKNDFIVASNVVPQTKKKKIVVSLDSGWPSRNYPVEKTDKLIDLLVKDYCVILVGYYRGYIYRARPDFINLLGKTKRVGEIFEIIKRSDAFIGVDSLPIHFASMLNIPTVGIWTVTEPRHVIAVESNIFIKLQADISCSPCYKEVCDRSMDCYSQISPEKIKKSVDSIFQGFK